MFYRLALLICMLAIDTRIIVSQDEVLPGDQTLLLVLIEKDVVRIETYGYDEIAGSPIYLTGTVSDAHCACVISMSAAEMRAVQLTLVADRVVLQTAIGKRASYYEINWRMLMGEDIATCASTLAIVEPCDDQEQSMVSVARLFWRDRTDLVQKVCFDRPVRAMAAFIISSGQLNTRDQALGILNKKMALKTGILARKKIPVLSNENQITIDAEPAPEPEVVLDVQKPSIVSTVYDALAQTVSKITYWLSLPYVYAVTRLTLFNQYMKKYITYCQMRERRVPMRVIR